MSLGSYKTQTEYLNEKLEQSIPKKDIQEILYQSTQVNFWISPECAYKHITEELERLIKGET